MSMSKVLVEMRGKAVPCSVDYSYEGVWRRRWFEITVYKSLIVMKKKEWKNTYIITRKEHVDSSFTAPEGAIVYLCIDHGSRKYSRARFEGFFVVKNNESGEVKEGEITVTYKNLKPLQKLSDEQLAEIEAEIINKYNALPSRFDPVRSLYYYWLRASP